MYCNIYIYGIVHLLHIVSGKLTVSDQIGKNLEIITFLYPLYPRTLLLLVNILEELK